MKAAPTFEVLDSKGNWHCNAWSEAQAYVLALGIRGTYRRLP